MLAATLPALLAFVPQTSLITGTVDEPSDGGAIYAGISADGRWVSFQSGASNLVPGDTNGRPDTYLYDRETGVMRRLSVADDGTEGNGDSLDPEISLDGSRVTWFSYASNLVPGDTNGGSDIFVHDVAAGSTWRVPSNLQMQGTSRYPVLSGDGRYVAFETTASNLLPGDTNGGRDVYRVDLETDEVLRVSLSSTGGEGAGESLDASISADGRYIAFESTAPDLVPGDTNGASDVFIKDMLTGELRRVSMGLNGAEPNGSSVDPFLSADGQRVCYSSQATNLIPLDSNGYEDLFLYDLATGETERVNQTWNGEQPHVGAYEGALSPDGQFVAFFSAASNLVPGDNNSELDVFVRDLACGATQRVSLGPGSLQGNGSCFYPALSEGGRYVVFDSLSDNLVPGDGNQQRDVFLHDRQETYLSFCHMDGQDGNVCPCDNFGQLGEGCANSSGSGGRLEASGPASVGQDTLRFIGHGLLPGNPALLFYGDQLAGQGYGVPFGDGRRCVGGQIVRVGIASPNAGGAANWGPGLFSNLNLNPGDTARFQVWYRDPTSTCGAGFNLTQALEVCLRP